MKLRLAIFLGILSLFLIARTCPAPTMGMAITAGDGITITNGAIINADKGTTAVVGTAGKMPMFTATNIVGDTTQTDTQARTKHLRFAILDASTIADTTICLIPALASAITVTNLELTCDTDPDTEIEGDIMWADSFISKANAAVIETFDTASGVRSDNDIASPAVATGKCVYIIFDTTPDVGVKMINFDITYTVN